MDPRKISIEDYSYQLPDERIAWFPMEQRDGSKLLIYRNGEISQNVFSNIVSQLPPHSTIVFNNTRVVEARLLFKKPTGATIEIFCLEPADADISTALASTGPIRWKCMVGNAAAWTSGLVLETEGLQARMTARETDHFLIEFSWNSEINFAGILQAAGLIPLPPYIKRKAGNMDTERYQTVYARAAGSVAAPTAGLHFTHEVMKKLGASDIDQAYVTLHVGAGTFKPVKSSTMNDHEMHGEFIEISRALVEKLLGNIQRPVIAVGTTSLRTLESIYWIGYKIYCNPDISAAELNIDQWYPYDKKAIETEKVLLALLQWMSKMELELLITKTSLLIAPGYSFRIVSVLITNFHQPRSTLLLLVAAFIGDQWKNIYQHALDNHFRFLSYGDACLFFHKRNI